MSQGFGPAGYPTKPPVSYQIKPTTVWVDPSSTGVTRRRGALRYPGLDTGLGAGLFNLHLGTVTAEYDDPGNGSLLDTFNLSNPGWSHGDTVEVRLVRATAPGKPTGLTATASGNTQIDLAWTAPADGGRAITGYRIEVSEDGGTNWTDLEADTGNDDTSYSH